MKITKTGSSSELCVYVYVYVNLVSLVCMWMVVGVAACLRVEKRLRQD